MACSISHARIAAEMQGCHKCSRQYVPPKVVTGSSQNVTSRTCIHGLARNASDRPAPHCGHPAGAVRAVLAETQRAT